MLLDLATWIEEGSDVLLTTVSAMADLPVLWSSLFQMVDEGEERQRALDALLVLLVCCGVGGLAEGSLAGLLRPVARRLEAMAPPDGDVWTWMRRVPLVVGRLFSDLAPLIAFTFAVTAMLGVLRPETAVALITLMVMHLWVVARCGIAVARMLLSPASNHLRLLPFSDPMAAYLIIWLRRMLFIGLTGYALAEAGLLIGMPVAAHGAIVRLTLMVITFCLVRIIKQQQGRVAALLRSPPLDPEEEPPTRAGLMIRRGRDWLAARWHLLGIAWLFGFWVVWAIGVERGFVRMLHASALTVPVLTGSWLADEGVRRLLRMALHPGPKLRLRAPWLQLKARHYAPPIRAAWAVILTGVVGILLLQIWGYGSLAWFEAGHSGRRIASSGVSILATVVVAMLVWEGANGMIERQLSRAPQDSKTARGTRLRTLLPVLRAFVACAVFAFVVFIVLDEIGINIGPLIAGAGVLGLAIGFGSQKLVQDVITGVFLLFEDSVAVGDVVSLGDRTGVVEHLTIRSIKLRAMDGSIHWVPFSAVTTVTNMTRDYAFAVLDVTVGWQEDPDRVLSVLRRIGRQMRTDGHWQSVMTSDLEAGLEKMTDMGLVFRVRAKTDPAQRWAVARELNRRIRVEFAQSGVDVPPPAQRLNAEMPEQSQLTVVPTGM